MPTRWQPPQPLSPPMYGCGCRLLVGIAAIATQPLECLPAMYWSYCLAWQALHVSAVGIAALAASSAPLCASPWHFSQPNASAIALFFQSLTIPGLTFSWHSMHALPAA